MRSDNLYGWQDRRRYYLRRKAEIAPLSAAARAELVQLESLFRDRPTRKPRATEYKRPEEYANAEA